MDLTGDLAESSSELDRPDQPEDHQHDHDHADDSDATGPHLSLLFNDHKWTSLILARRNKGTAMVR